MSNNHNNSSNFRVIPFKAEHIECMDIREYERETVCTTPGFDIALKEWEKKNTMWTIISQGRTIAVFGVWELWKGVAELVMLPSIYLGDDPLAFSRCARTVMESGLLKSFHRVQLRALDDELHNRFNAYLGFKKEGVLKKYDSFENDFAIWAKVR